MKCKNKVLITIGIVLIIIICTAFGIYEFYGKDKIEETLEKAQQVLTDETVRKEIDEFVQEMGDTGVLNEVQVQEYNEQKQHSSAEQKEQEKQQSTVEQEKQQGTVEQKKYTEQNAPKTQKENHASTTPTRSSENSTSLMDRVKSAMTADEFAFAMSVYSRVDTGYVLSNINTNRAAVKKYIQSVLSGDEISRSLAIYNKYSHLLN